MRCVARAIAVALATTLLLTGCSGSRSGSSGPLKIGVMLPLSGPDARGLREPLEWAVENVNAAGGAAGRKLELDYADLGSTTVDAATRAFAADPWIVAVIGPDTSDRFFALAPALIEAKKTIVSPTATSGDIFRAFSSSGYVWRTVQSDIAQVRTALLLLARDGMRRPAIVTGVDHYSATFYDWFGFYANELELQPAALERYDQATQDCTASVNKALASKPDALLAAAKDEANAVCIAKAWRAKGSPGRLLFTDAAEAPALIDDLGAQADGLEGIGLSEDPKAGFVKAYTERFGHVPHDAAASTYDAVALLAYGLERSDGAGGEELNRALADVVDARGTKTSWDGPGIATALEAIKRGDLPDVNGAAGPLVFDAFTHTDLISSTYVHWAVESGKFTAIDVLPSGPARPGVSDARVTALESLEQNYRAHGGRPYDPPLVKKGLWAVLVATSHGWENYRHQADVFAQYQMLRAAGVPPARIIVIAADDLADNPKNQQPGRVPYELDGDDVRAGVPIDYHLDDVNADAFLAILSGRRSASLPKVVASSESDNVYVYIAGHGDADGVYFGVENPVIKPGDEYSVLRPDALAATVSQMQTAGRYRRMLIAVEACKGGVMGAKVDAPGAMLISAASPTENSISTNFDGKAGVWLADQFSAELVRTMRGAVSEDLPLGSALSKIYLSVSGSHVSSYGSRFGDAQAVGLREFVTP